MRPASKASQDPRHCVKVDKHHKHKTSQDPHHAFAAAASPEMRRKVAASHHEEHHVGNISPKLRHIGDAEASRPAVNFSPSQSHCCCKKSMENVADERLKASQCDDHRAERRRVRRRRSSFIRSANYSGQYSKVSGIHYERAEISVKVNRCSPCWESNL